MHDVLKSLEAHLQKEVDLRVAEVQAASDEIVAAFRKHAEAIARGEIAAKAPVESVQQPSVAPVVTLPPGVLEEVGNLFGRQQYDEAAAAANMRI